MASTTQYQGCEQLSSKRKYNGRLRGAGETSEAGAILARVGKSVLFRPIHLFNLSLRCARLEPQDDSSDYNREFKLEASDNRNVFKIVSETKLHNNPTKSKVEIQVGMTDELKGPEVWKPKPRRDS